MASSVTFEELLDTFPGGGFAADVTPMPLTRGAVNRVYRVPHPAGDLVLRRHASPAQRRVLGADLDVELQLQAQAASAGFAPPVLHHDADLGVTWMPFVDARPLEADWWRDATRREAMQKLLQRLRALPISADLPPFDLATRLASLQNRLRAIDARRAALHARAFEAVSLALQAHDWAASASCCIVHGDLGPHNVLVRADGELVLLDWEYAHRGHVLEDPAGLWVAATAPASAVAKSAAADPQLRDWLVRRADVASSHERFAVLAEARRVLDAQWEALAVAV
ncbi:MAG: aminoglycoside phosphotransferase family protein [Gammaproteobacteria bacterium]|jgi:aminoglycoside phosphotransferase (APT) family kinase protein|nr:aminoglycoside phosphotransferase family protein [Gammaproteobacteria bacterium]